MIAAILLLALGVVALAGMVILRHGTRSPARVPRFEHRGVPAEQEINVASDSHGPAVFEKTDFEIHWSLRGRCVSETGVPLPDVTITSAVLDPTTDRLGIITSLVSRADGTFECEIGQAGPAWVQVRTRGAGRAEAVRKIQLPIGGGRADLGDLILPGGVLVRGVVRLSGVPLAGARIDWRHTRTAAEIAETSGVALTGTDGALSLRVPVGTLALFLSDSKVGSRMFGARLVLSPARPEEYVEINLDPTEGRRLRVVDEAGDPIPSPEVILLNWSVWPTIFAEIRAECQPGPERGEWLLLVPPESTVQGVVRAPGRLAEPLMIRAGVSDLGTIELGPAASTLRVELVGNDTDGRTWLYGGFGPRSPWFPALMRAQPCATGPSVEVPIDGIRIRQGQRIVIVDKSWTRFAVTDVLHAAALRDGTTLRVNVQLMKNMPVQCTHTNGVDAIDRATVSVRRDTIGQGRTTALLQAASTDRAGEVVLRIPPLPFRWVLHASAAGYGDESLVITGADEGASIRMSAATASIAVEVVPRSATRDVACLAENTGRILEADGVNASRVHFTSVPAGRYLLGHRGVLRWLMRAPLDSFAIYKDFSGMELIEVKDDNAHIVRLEVLPAGWIEGRIQGSISLLQRLSIDASCPTSEKEWRKIQPVVPTSDGAFQIGPLNPGVYALRVFHGGTRAPVFVERLAVRSGVVEQVSIEPAWGSCEVQLAGPVRSSVLIRITDSQGYEAALLGVQDARPVVQLMPGLYDCVATEGTKVIETVRFSLHAGQSRVIQLVQLPREE